MLGLIASQPLTVEELIDDILLNPILKLVNCLSSIIACGLIRSILAQLLDGVLSNLGRESRDRAFPATAAISTLNLWMCGLNL